MELNLIHGEAWIELSRLPTLRCSVHKCILLLIQRKTPRSLFLNAFYKNVCVQAYRKTELVDVLVPSRFKL